MKISEVFKGKKQGTAMAAASPTAAPSTTPPLEVVQPSVVRSSSEIEQAVIEVLRTVFDPEIPVNIYEMGLIYEIDVDTGGRVLVRMTLTSPGCPVAGSLMPEIERKIAAVPGVTDVVVELVWEPPWDPSRMTDAARLQLGMF
jgi:FeS assembly SUF system protein